MYKGGHPLVYIMCNTQGNDASATCASVAGYSADRAEPVCKKLGLLFAPPVVPLAPARAPYERPWDRYSTRRAPATSRARPARRGHHPPPASSVSSGVKGLARSKRSITAPIWAL